MWKYICENCLREVKMTARDFEVVKYLSSRKGNPKNKWDYDYYNYSTSVMKKELKMSPTTMNAHLHKLRDIGIVEMDTFKVIGRESRFPTVTYRLTAKGQSMMRDYK